MANVMAAVAFVCCFVALHGGMLIWAAVILPGPVGRARSNLISRPYACLAWGIFLIIAGFVLLAFLVPQRDAGFRDIGDLLTLLTALSSGERFSNDARILTHAIGWLAVSPLMAAWAIGGAGFSRLFADRAGRDWNVRSPARGLVAGSVCTSVGYLVPFVSWFVFLPLVGALSVGAGAMAIVLRGTRARILQILSTVEQAGV